MASCWSLTASINSKRPVAGMQSNNWGVGVHMKPRDSAVKAKRFEVAEKARKIASLEGTIRDFELMATDLARQIANEEDRTGKEERLHEL